MAVIDDELHTAGLGDDLLHLGKVDEESTMATDNHRVIMKIIFHLLGGGTNHIGTYLLITQMAYLHIVADRFYEEQIVYIQCNFLARRS